MTETPTSTAAKAIAGALIRKLITVAGTAIVARGWIEQNTVSAATGPLADYALGVFLVLLSTGWGVLRARAMHWRWIAALYAPALPKEN